MGVGINIKLKSTVKERVKFILKDYKYFTKEPELMMNAMRVLKKIIKKDDYKVIEESLSNGDYITFVEALINHHYDKVYKKTRSEINDQNDYVININKINNKNCLEIIKNNKIFI